MFKIDQKTKQIRLTRGDIASFIIKTKNDDGTLYTYTPGDTITLSIYEKKNLENLKLQKSVEIQEPTQEAELNLTSEETKLDELINKPKDYWYEVSLNDEQTIIGYDEEGPKLFTLYPEGE